ncbi:ABC transporter permease [Halalkalicoccus jeotgali]|uniref:Binding-protein-dependent transport systems inner membrane component n=1 Tax=Halalkalicoccus jeotgali (strain DSM 18796 / CECT 7217 / JCM 14584 / KCTC 4019 / B3) TaxID=795797 RepID=D8J6K3_HALJB|nr:ABC transporter permease [Halalkalicoccus jeotgali]ADJ13880.1 binding-protein-dependent transport systems inner membrane component [Halalkalicoccus jeotgali B3]ELY34073.1 binding-protein-dependent transport systems inner membrane component [Halalkalicoccus jeotgali B3]
MSTETQTTTEGRGIVERLRASPFLTKLLSNRLAIVGLLIIAGALVVAVYARFAYDIQALTATRYNTNPTEAAPSAQYWFGTDGQARDIFPRVLYGAWYAMKFGTVTVAASTVLGVGLGIVAAYYGDLTDNVIMRTMDVLLSFPSLLLALALVTVFPDSLGLWRAVAALTLVYTPRFARVVRGTALKVLEDEYIDATYALGATDPRLLVRHVLPNCLAPITVQSTLNFGLAIIDIAALSFLGFGASPGSPSWGMMLSNGVNYGLFSGAWWWSFFPGLVLALLVLGFNLLGDGMRDALDPRMRETVD